MSNRYRPHRQQVVSATGDYNMVHATSLTCCTTGYEMTYRTPVGNSMCSYCGTRYYLVAGDRMNCTQCGAPI